MAALPSLTTLRAAIALEIRKALNPGVPANVLTVHEYRRFWRDEQKFRKLFERKLPDLMPGKLNGWMIQRFATTEVETEERWRFYQLHRFELHGYMGIQDEDVLATENVFQDQIEVIRDNLRLSRPVFGNMERVVPVTQVDTVEPVTLGDSTVWYAKLTLVTEGIENKTETP